MPRIIGSFQQRILTFVQESADRGEGVSLSDITQAMSPDSSTPASSGLSTQTRTAISGLVGRELLSEGLPILESSEQGSGQQLYYPHPLPEAINARIRTELMRRLEAERQPIAAGLLEEYRAAIQAVGGDPSAVPPPVLAKLNEAKRDFDAEPRAVKLPASRITPAEAQALAQRILRGPSTR